jgi:hypothetical protein
LKSGEGADQIASFVIEKGRISKVGCVAVCVTFLGSLKPNFCAVFRSRV